MITQHIFAIVNAAPVPDMQADPNGFFDGIWELWKRGLITPALMLLFHAANTIALARWAWLSTTFPWLANGRWLAIASALQGATAGLVPLAATGDLPAAAVFAAVITAVAQWLRPTPKTVTVKTEEAAAKIDPVVARAVVIKEPKNDFAR